MLRVKDIMDLKMNKLEKVIFTRAENENWKK